MRSEKATEEVTEHRAEIQRTENPEHFCPVCSSRLVSEKCKVVCRSEQCVYRIVFNCSEF